MKTLATVLALVAVLGCGYGFPGAVSNLPPDIKTIAIPVFENRSQEPGIENDFTSALVFEFKRTDVLKVVDASRAADVVLKGVVKALFVNPVAYRQDVVAVERRVDIVLGIKVVRPSGEVIWQNENLPDNEVFPVAADPLTTERNKRQAIKKLAERMAFQVHNLIVESF